MDISARAISALVGLTLQNPRAAARYILALHVPDTARWLLALFVSTASVLLTYAGFSLLPATDTALMAFAMVGPVRTALIQTGFLIITAVGVHRIGRWRGGNGNFPDALLLIGWLQFILLCLQVVQLFALVVLPPLAQVIGFVGLVLTFWMLSQFIVELHGFSSAWRVFASILGVMFMLAMAAFMVIVMTMGAAGVGNV